MRERQTGLRRRSAFLVANYVLSALLGGSTAEAAKRGDANTDTRSNWCADRNSSCRNAVEDDCSDRFGNDVAGELQCNSDGWNH